MQCAHRQQRCEASAQQRREASALPAQRTAHLRCASPGAARLCQARQGLCASGGRKTRRASSGLRIRARSSASAGRVSTLARRVWMRSLHLAPATSRSGLGGRWRLPPQRLGAVGFPLKRLEAALRRSRHTNGCLPRCQVWALKRLVHRLWEGTSPQVDPLCFASRDRGLSEAHAEEVQHSFSTAWGSE